MSFLKTCQVNHCCGNKYNINKFQPFIKRHINYALYVARRPNLKQLNIIRLMIIVCALFVAEIVSSQIQLGINLKVEVAEMKK